MQKFVGPVEVAIVSGAVLVIVGVDQFSRPAAAALLILAGAALLALGLVATLRRPTRVG